MKTITLKDIMEYFNISMNEFRGQWSKMTLQDKEDIKNGLSNETYTY